jgi:hypothetical protein
MSSSEKREQLLQMCNILQALLAFNYHYTPQRKMSLEHIREDAKVATTKKFRNLRDFLNKAIDEAASTFGCVLRPHRFAAWFMEQRYDKSRKYGGVSKAIIDSQLFVNFCGGPPEWKEVSPHQIIYVDFDLVASGYQDVVWYLAEATLYEDMALAYNSAAESESRVMQLVHVQARPQYEVKKLNLHLRTAVLSAFYFVESYLNGVGFDYFYRNQSKLSQQQRDLLTEWDSQRNRRSWASFDRKVLDYPKVILQAKHPPFTATNSKNLKILLGEGKDCRDAIVHQSPKTDDILGAPEKVLLMYGLSLEKVTRIVDAAVGFVAELNSALGSNGIKSAWLHPRSPKHQNLFPPEAFA